MRIPAIRLSTLVVTAAMLAGAAAVTPVRSETSHGKHFKKHHTVHMSRGSRDYRAPDRAWAAVRPAGAVAGACPGGIGRSFECSRWPPPIDEDPDRVISGSAGD
jgi:hypothetical protein